MYKAAIDTAMENIFFRPMNPSNLDIPISGKLKFYGDTSSFYPESEHLACFLGGMVGLGGKIFSKPSHVDRAEKLTQGCIWAYKSTLSGIMPENYSVIKWPTPECLWDEKIWRQQASKWYPKGFTNVGDV
jgi:mannosyl-oligosaccharide alpha-1,2-mannosidase